MSSDPTSRWLPRVGALITLIAAGCLAAVSGWSPGMPLPNPVTSAVTFLGTALSLAVVWTGAQALIHTRLGTRPLLSEPAPEPLVPLSLGVRIVGLTMLAVLGWKLAGQAYWLGHLWSATGSPALVVELFATLVLIALPSALVIGCGLGFGLVLLQHRIRRDRLTDRVRARLTG